MEQNNGVDANKPVPYVPVFEIRQLGRKDQTWKGPILLAGSHGRGLFKAESLLTSTREVNNDISLPLYPNPAKNHITIPSAMESASYQIIDLCGKIILSGVINQTNKISVSVLKTGIYIVRVNQSNGTTFSEKLIIR